jgi:murein DD-endopeptidase MepM/ murein hydrolase activator NlpD
MTKQIMVPYAGCKLFDVTQGFGVKQSFDGAPHQGVDFAFAHCKGKFLVAPEKCTVIQIITDETLDNDYYPGLERGYGIVMRPYSDSTIEYLYWHCQQVFPVNIGQVVEQGEIVAQIGNSGMCMSAGVLVPLSDRNSEAGSHLHYEKRISGVLVNVLPYIDFSLQPKLNVIKAVSQILTKMANMILNRK